MNDSEFTTGDPVKRPVFDPTVNLGHILTALAMLASGFAAYSSLDRRLTAQEVRSEAAETQARDQDARIRDALQELKADVRETRRSVDEVGRRLTEPPPKK